MPRKSRCAKVGNPRPKINPRASQISTSAKQMPSVTPSAQASTPPNANGVKKTSRPMPARIR